MAGEDRIVGDVVPVIQNFSKFNMRMSHAMRLIRNSQLYCTQRTVVGIAKLFSIPRTMNNMRVVKVHVIYGKL